MAYIYIEYDPRNIHTKIKYDGVTVSSTSNLYKFFDKKLESWIEELLPVIENELYDSSYTILFRGSYNEFQIVSRSITDTKNALNVNCYFLADPEFITYEDLKLAGDESTEECNLQNCYGVAYHHGLGITVDCSRAKGFYELAIQQGCFDAQYNLGRLFYDGGEGITQNHAQAMRLFNEAAQNEHPYAQYYVYEMYFNGLGTEKNNEAAFEWCLRSAINGYEEAQYKAAEMFYDAVGTPKDDSEAFEWYKRAASQSYTPAVFRLAEAYFNGSGVAKSLEKAFELYQKAALKGNAEAQYKLGLMYFQATAAEKNDAEAAKWYTQAANQGNNKAKFNLAYMFLNGYGLAKDEAKAYGIFKELAEAGINEAAYSLALLYIQGIGVKQNISEAVKWLEKLAALGHSDSLLMLGDINYNTQGIANTDKDTSIKVENLISVEVQPQDGSINRNSVEISTYTQKEFEKISKGCEKVKFLNRDDLIKFSNTMKKECKKIDKTVVALELIDSPIYKYKITQFFLDAQNNVLYDSRNNGRVYGRVLFAFAVSSEFSKKMINSNKVKVIIDVKG